MSESSRETITAPGRVGLWIVVAAAVVGFLAGRAMTGPDARAAADNPGATATRAAELEELEHLRTRVAQTVVCTAPPTAEATMTPTPSPSATAVPPVAAGEIVRLTDQWTLVVNGFSRSAPIDGVQADGTFVQVQVSLTNDAPDDRRYDFGDWMLTDAQGRTFGVARNATSAVFLGWTKLFSPSSPKDGAIVFDVAVDSGPAFLLESRTDPFLRIALQLQAIG